LTERLPAPMPTIGRKSLPVMGEIATLRLNNVVNSPKLEFCSIDAIINRTSTSVS